MGKYILILLLLVILCGLYSFSGLPIPFSSPESYMYENAKIQKYLALGRLVSNAETSEIRAILLKQPDFITVDGNTGKIENELFIICDKPVQYDLVIIGKNEDKSGMVCAVKKQGKVLKVFPSEITIDNQE